MQLIQAVLPHFRRTGGGRVVNVSSGSGLVAEPLMAAYAASKHAVEGLTEAVAYERATQGVTVKLVEPGFVQGTNFVVQTQQSSLVVPVSASYQAFVAQTMAMYMVMGAAAVELATEDEVARVILKADSDDVDQLRYPVGADTLAKRPHALGNVGKGVPRLDPDQVCRQRARWPVRTRNRTRRWFRLPERRWKASATRCLGQGGARRLGSQQKTGEEYYVKKRCFDASKIPVNLSSH